MNNVFSYILDNNIALIESDDFGLDFGHIAELRNIMGQILENIDEGIIERYEFPNLVYYLDQIKEFLDKQEKIRMRDEIESLSHSNKSLEERIWEITTNHADESQELRDLLRDKEHKIQSLTDEYDARFSELNQVIKEKDMEIEQKDLQVKEKENTKSELEKENEKLKESFKSEIQPLLDKIEKITSSHELITEEQELQVKNLNDQVVILRSKERETIAENNDAINQLKIEIGSLNERVKENSSDKIEMQLEIEEKRKELTAIKKKKLETEKAWRDKVSDLTHEKIRVETEKKQLLKEIENLKTSSSDLMKPTVALAPFYLILVDLNNIKNSWDKNKGGLRFTISILYDNLTGLLKSMDKSFDVNDVKGFIFVSGYFEALKRDSDGIKAQGTSPLIDKFEWFVNKEKKNSKLEGILDKGTYQDIDTYLTFKAGEMLTKHNKNIKGLILVSGDKDMIPTAQKAKEMGINTVILGVQKTISPALSRYANRVCFF